MKKGFKYLLSLALTLSVFAMGGCAKEAMVPMTWKDMVAETDKEVRQLSPSESKALFDEGGHVFLDVREPKEHKMGHIPGAMLIPRGLMEWKIGEKIVDKNAKIIMYCKSGGRSSLSAHSIQRMGYTNVWNLHGGWKAWQNAGYPAE